MSEKKTIKVMGKIDLSKIESNDGKKFEYVGALGLEREIIPREHAKRLVAFVDEDTAFKLASLALRRRITDDEAIRQILRAFFSSEDFKDF